MDDRGPVHPMWERGVHPWSDEGWVCFTTLDEQSQSIVLCWHCGQQWPCHEALIRNVDQPKCDYGAPAS